MWMREVVNIRGAFGACMHERYGSYGRNQRLIDTRVAFGADGCSSLAVADVEQLGLVTLMP